MGGSGMKLDVHRNGVKLFFITFAVMGRMPVLSRLVDENSRPLLLPLGELVTAAIRALHLVRAAVGTSDYVIMPDHVHFIMVVDYLRDRIASPLWLAHRLMDAVELAVDAGWGQPTGTCGPRTPAAQAATSAGMAAAQAAGLLPPTPEIMAAFLREACDAADRASGFGAAPRPEPAAYGGAGASAPVGSQPIIFERCAARKTRRRHPRRPSSTRWATRFFWPRPSSSTCGSPSRRAWPSTRPPSPKS